MTALMEAVTERMLRGMTVEEAHRTYGIRMMDLRKALTSATGGTWHRYRHFEPPREDALSMTPERVALTVEMYADGVTYHEMAAMLGVPLGTLSTHIDRHRDMYPYRRERR